MSFAYMAIKLQQNKSHLSSGHQLQAFSVVLFFPVLFFLFFLLPIPCSAQELSQQEGEQADNFPSAKLAPIQIGAIFSLTGYGAVAGQSELDAIQMALSDINSGGGINGRHLEMMIEDNQSSLKGTISAFQKLHSLHHVSVILGPNWAEFSEVVAPLAEQNKIVMLTASGYTETLTKNRKFVFTTLPQFEVHVKPITDALVKRHPKKIALLTTSNTYFESISKALRNNLAQAGLKLSHELSVEPGNTDYRSMLLKLKNDGVDAIIPFLQEGGELASFFKQLQELNIQVKIYTHDIVFDEVLSKRPTLAEGASFFRYMPDAPQEFLDRYRREYKREPMVNVPKAYDNVFLIQDAMLRCGLKSEQIRQCLLQADYSGHSGRIRFSPSGNVIGMENLTKLYQVVNGKFSPETL